MAATVSEQRYVVNDSVVSAVVQGEAVLLNVETGVYFGLDEVGTCIWELLEEGTAESGIVTRLLADYDIDEAELRRDVSDFLAKLQTNELVRNAKR